MEKVLIITGGNKGIGAGITAAYLKRNYRIFSISRSKNLTYPNEIQHIECDLSKGIAAKKALTDIFTMLVPDQIQEITLINNAGTLGNIGTLESLVAEDIQQTVQLNTIAPLILTSEFLKLTASWSVKKQVLNISSGAARNPYFGWAIYCATKASLDMMGKVAALEQGKKENGAKILTVYPGVVDTEMQGQIRSTPKENFIDVEKFVDYKSSGTLADAEVVGEKIFVLASDQNMESGAIVDIRDLKD